MSYCVNCGVELAPSERCCPLCDVEVQNPKQPRDERAPRPYSNHVEKIVEHVDRKYGVGLASMFLLIPSLVTLIGDLLTSFRVTWSAYVVGACFVLYVIGLFPLLFRKPHPFLFILLDVAAILLYLMLIDYFSGGMSWFMPLAMPMTLVAAGLTAVTIFMLRLQEYPALYKAAAILSVFGISTIAIDIVIRSYHGLAIWPGWSLFVLAPCLVLAVMMVYTERHKTIKDEIRRRLFY